MVVKMRLNEFGFIAVKNAVSVKPAPDQFRTDMKDILLSIQASLASLAPMLEMLADDGDDANQTELDLSRSNNTTDLTL